MVHLRSKLLRRPQKAGGPSSSSSCSSLGTGRRPPPRPYTYQGRESFFLVLNKDTSSLRLIHPSIPPSIRIKVGRHSHSSSVTLPPLCGDVPLPTNCNCCSDTSPLQVFLLLMGWGLHPARVSFKTDLQRFRCRKGRKDLSSQQPWSRYMRWCEHHLVSTSLPPSCSLCRPSSDASLLEGNNNVFHVPLLCCAVQRRAVQTFLFDYLAPAVVGIGSPGDLLFLTRHSPPFLPTLVRFPLSFFCINCVHPSLSSPLLLS
ncbi:hypothetical protein GW17_00037517 [Ensete ventricosum]|nr:hypothetical protein GW17_00037517 [Ensete ventricosum]